MAVADLTLERVRSVLDYNPDTGVFRWTSSEGPKARNNGFAGTICSRTGYLAMRVDRVGVLGHRLAWFYMTGSWPDGQIDHINHIRSDNRFSNLRVVSVQENAQNRCLRSRHGTTEYLGVRDLGESAGKLRFKAVITHNRKPLYIGRFATAVEAAAAYFGAKKMVHKGFYSLGHESSNNLTSEA